MENWLEKIYDILMKIFGSVSKSTEPKLPPNDRLKNRHKRALIKAAHELGVKEVIGNGNNAKVVKYHAYARKDNDVSKGLADSVPWCSSFICYVLENCFGPNDGMSSTNSMQARSYLGWGVSVKRNPLPGDIVVYWRGSKNGWTGHVGFYLGHTNGNGEYIYTLGGNQSDSVSVARYHKSKLLDIRRSSKQLELTEPEQDELWDIAERLISGKKIDTDGKVI